MTAHSECSLGIDSCSDSEGRATPMPDDDRLTPTPGQSSSLIYDHSACRRDLVSRRTNFESSMIPRSDYGRTISPQESTPQRSVFESRSSSRAGPRKISSLVSNIYIKIILSQ